MRQYNAIDMLRFRKFAKTSNKPSFELLKDYNRLHPELTAKERLVNLAIGLKVNGLHKALTGVDIPKQKRKNKGQYEVWDWVVDINGKTIQIDHDDMAELPYENIKRHATEKEITDALNKRNSEKLSKTK